MVGGTAVSADRPHEGTGQPSVKLWKIMTAFKVANPQIVMPTHFMHPGDGSRAKVVRPAGDSSTLAVQGWENPAWNS